MSETTSKRFFRIFMSIVLFFVSFWAFEAKVKRRIAKIKERNQIEKVAIKEIKTEKINNDSNNDSENRYVTYGDLLAQKELLDVNSAECMIISIENLLELDKTDDSTLSRKEKEYLERTRVEFVKLAKEKGSKKY